MLAQQPMTAMPSVPAAGDPPPGVLAGRLAALLADREPGWRLPRISELARRYDVTTADMEAAVADLARRHLLRQLRDGLVYRASPAEYLTTFEPLPGLGSVIDPMGATITCTHQRIQQQPVPEYVRQALHLAPGAQACCVRRTWASGRCRAAVSTACLSAYLAGQLAAEGSLPGIGAILHPPPASAPACIRRRARVRSTWRAAAAPHGRPLAPAGRRQPRDHGDRDVRAASHRPAVRLDRRGAAPRPVPDSDRGRPRVYVRRTRRQPRSPGSRPRTVLAELADRAGCFAPRLAAVYWAWRPVRPAGPGLARRQRSAAR